jgi:hypothetical protein
VLNLGKRGFYWGVIGSRLGAGMGWRAWTGVDHSSVMPPPS